MSVLSVCFAREKVIVAIVPLSVDRMASETRQSIQWTWRSDNLSRVLESSILASQKLIVLSDSDFDRFRLEQRSNDRLSLFCLHSEFRIVYDVRLSLSVFYRKIRSNVSKRLQVNVFESHQLTVLEAG
jgi:hypothetical protein